jgi:hypothetical protein
MLCHIYLPLQVVTSHFLAVTLRDITLYVVNNINLLYYSYYFNLLNTI